MRSAQLAAARGDRWSSSSGTPALSGGSRWRQPGTSARLATLISSLTTTHNGPCAGPQPQRRWSFCPTASARSSLAPARSRCCKGSRRRPGSSGDRCFAMREAAGRFSFKCTASTVAPSRRLLKGLAWRVYETCRDASLRCCRRSAMSTGSARNSIHLKALPLSGSTSARTRGETSSESNCPVPTGSPRTRVTMRLWLTTGCASATTRCRSMRALRRRAGASCRTASAMRD